VNHFRPIIIQTKRKEQTDGLLFLYEEEAFKSKASSLYCSS